MRTILGAAVLGAVVLMTPSTASAQTSDRWSQWVGCWALVNENVHEGSGSARAAALSPVNRPEEAVESGPRVCVVRSGNGVTMTTTVPGQTPITQSLVADGSPHDIVDSTCRGVERTEWSASGKRLFARAEVTCDDNIARTISGMGFITASGDWIDIRNFHIEGDNATRVTRYRRAAGVSVMGSPLTLDEIKDASAKVAAPVLEAAIAETRPRVKLNRDSLVDLADANVPPSVIDVLVAVTWPDRFVIDAPKTARASSSGGGAYSSVDYYDYYGWSGAYYPAYYYSPFAFGYIGRYDPYFYGRPAYGGGYGGNDSSKPAESGAARAINGQGYTRVRPADVATPRSGSNANRAFSSNSSGSTTSSSSSSNSGSSTSSSSSNSGSSGSSGSGSSSSGASPQGYSGGSSDGGGRTAQPR